MSKLFNTILTNLFQDKGRGLEEDVVEVFNNTNKDVDTYLEYTNPNKSPVSRAFLLDIPKSLKEGFMYNVEQFNNKEHEELLKDFNTQKEFLKENSKSKGFLKKERNDPFDAFVEMESSKFDFEPFKTSLKSVQSDKNTKMSFPAKLVCAVIEAKTSMDLSQENIDKMYEIEKQLIPYIYAYANKNENTTHLEIQNEIFSYFGLNNNPSKTRNFKARDYLRGLSINYLIKTHSQNDPIKNTDVEGNSLEYGLKTVYLNGELGKIFIQQDQKVDISEDLKTTQLIKLGQIAEYSSNGQINFIHKSKYLQQALLNIHKKLNSNNSISDNNDFLTTAVAYLILAQELQVKDVGDFIGIALADPITEIAKTLSKNEIEKISNKGYDLANIISKEELNKEIEKPKTAVLTSTLAENKKDNNELANKKNLENFSRSEDKQKCGDTNNYLVRNFKKFYKLLLPKLIQNMNRSLEKYKSLQNKKINSERLTLNQKKNYVIYQSLYGNIEDMVNLITDMKSIVFDFTNIEKYMLKSLKSGKEFPEIEEKIKKAIGLTDKNLKKFESYYNFIKNYDNTKIIKLANILEIKDKALAEGVLRYYLPPKTKTKQPKIPQTENPGTENPKTENHGEKED